MKILIALSLLLSAQLTFAASIDSDINLLARRINNRAQSAPRLTQDEKIRLVKALNTADTILARVAEGGGPVNPNPNPYPYPQPPRRVCNSEPASEMQNTYIFIKAFAYSTTGLNLSTTEAEAYAANWIATQPCARAQSFATDFKRIKDFAYSTSGLDMSSAEANTYASQRVDSICLNYDLAGEFKKYYDFAYLTNGLNLTRAQSIAYARERIEVNAFSCRY